jgi:pimeloyl-ACP methyl ester carboxylesterase
MSIVNEIRLNYDEYGKGDPVVLVAGSGTRGRVWRSYQVPALLSSGYRAITFDNRGVPPTDKCLDGFTLDDMVADTAGLIELLQISPCRIVGFSLGAIIVQELLVARPALVSQAVLIATRGRTDPLNEALSLGEIDILDSGIELPWRYAAYMRLIQGFSPSTLNDDQRVQDWLDIMEITPFSSLMNRSQLQLDRIGNRLEAYKGISTPCLVVGLQNDLIMPPHLGQEVVSSIPGCRYQEIPDCGHYGYLEKPAAVSSAMIGFFRDA